MSTFWKRFLAIFGIAAVAGTAVVITTSDNDTTTTDSSGTHTQTPSPPPRPMYGINGITWFAAVGYDKEYFLRTIDSIGLDYVRIPGGTRMNLFNPETDTCSMCPGLPYIKTLVDYIHAHSNPDFFVMWGLNMSLPVDVELQWMEKAAAMGIFDKTKPNTPVVEGGNELNGASYDANLFLDGKQYGDSVASWRAKFKQHFPNVLFLAVGENKTGKYKKTWNADVRERNPDIPLTCHPYPDGKFTHNGMFDSAAFRALLDSEWTADFEPTIDPRNVYITEGNFTDHDNAPAAELDTLNEDQIGVATKFWYQYWTDKQCPFINKHNLVSSDLRNYPAVYVDKKTAYLTPAGRALREFIQSKK